MGDGDSVQESARRLVACGRDVVLARAAFELVAAEEAPAAVEVQRDAMRRTQRLLTVSVSDDSPAWPVLRYAYDRSVGHGPGLGGQGLRLVEALTRRWGWTPTTGGGRVVWAVLDAG
jgi:hypothetical protein